MPNHPSILLLGAGELGTALLSPLSTLPYTTTLATRSPQKYTHLTTTFPSLSLLALDLTHPSADLVPIFAQYDIVISATGFGASPDTLLKLANEVIAAGNLRAGKGGYEGEKEKLWFFPWQFGVDYDVTGDGEGLMPLFGAQKSVRDLLRSQNSIDWTIVSTGIFMSFLFQDFWGIVARPLHTSQEDRITVRALRDWEHGVTVTDVDDIGRVMGRIVAGNVDARNKVVYVAGGTVRYGELADVVEKVTGKAVVREIWGVEYLDEEVKKDPEDGIKKYRLVFARDGVMWDKAGTVNAQLGMEMMGVEEYARKVFSA
jgi:uncharacterized protein YbjT (DUF2867 family)